MRAEHVDAERPDPLPASELRAPDGVRLTRYLLAESLKRFRAARRLERERKIVYPETTCILRDCERLQKRLTQLIAEQAPPVAPRSSSAKRKRLDPALRHLPE